MLMLALAKRRIVRLLAAAKAAGQRGDARSAGRSRLKLRDIFASHTRAWNTLLPWGAHPIGLPPDAPSLAEPLSQKAGLTARLQAADRLRDTGKFAGAAQLYGEVLEQAPELNDIRVQFGNMLKDAGEVAAAEAVYRAAIAARPKEADIHLQLGHVLKLLGRRAEAMAAYRHALLLDPAATPAALELAALGDPAEQARVFDARLRAGSLEALLHVSGEIAELRTRLTRLAERLPELQEISAFPIELYGQYRDLFAVPVPPSPSIQNAIAVLLLADRETPSTLYVQLAAMRAQSHAAWRLLVVGQAGEHRQIVERAAAADPRISWTEIDGEPAAAELRMASSVQPDIVLLLAQAAVLDCRALGWFVAALDASPVMAFICDEEAAIASGKRLIRSRPVLRQVVDYDTLLECNVFGETIAVRAAWLREMMPRIRTDSLETARVSLLLELTFAATIGHVPYPLVHRDPPTDVAPTGTQAHRDAVAAHLVHVGSAAGIAPAEHADARPRLSILWRAQPTRIAVIIPTRDNSLDVRALVGSLRETADDAGALDILVIDNGGTDIAERQTLERLAASGAVRLATLDEPFNWSRLNNQGAAMTDAPLLIFANDDMRMLSHGWDLRIRGLLQRPEIGAVGARLLYADNTLQHGGIIFGWFPSPTHHDGLHRPAKEAGPLCRWQVTRAVSAVTGAFLATRRDLHEALGGFDEMALPVGYSDIDYALKLRSVGRKLLWTPHVTLHHFESKSRNLDRLDAASAARDDAERNVMLERWRGALETDPSVHPIWHSATLPFRLLAPFPIARAMSHIHATAAARPWAVSTRDAMVL